MLDDVKDYLIPFLETLSYEVNIINYIELLKLNGSIMTISIKDFDAFNIKNITQIRIFYKEKAG